MAVSHVAPAVGPGPTVATSVSAGAPAAPPPAASGAAAPVPSAPPPAAAQGVFPYMVGGGGPGAGFGSGHTRTATAVSRLKAPERDIAAVAAATAARRRSRRRRQQDAVMRGYADEYTDLDTDIDPGIPRRWWRPTAAAGDGVCRDRLEASRPRGGPDGVDRRCFRRRPDGADGAGHLGPRQGSGRPGTLRQQHNRARGLAALQVLVGAGRLGERIPSADFDGDVAAGDRVEQFGGPPAELFAGTDEVR